MPFRSLGRGSRWETTPAHCQLSLGRGITGDVVLMPFLGQSLFFFSNFLDLDLSFCGYELGMTLARPCYVNCDKTTWESDV